jgi:hypothetical protein
MRPRHASAFAVLCVVTILSLRGPSAVAQVETSRSGVTVRMDAIPADVTQAKPTWAGARERQPAHVAYLDEGTPWILPPEPPPETLETSGVLQCVPYARFMSGIGLHGDAWTWWEKASGIFARGNEPEPGAVLSFPGTERMPLGHVAVVTQVLTTRKILIDHANWPNAVVRHGAISRDIEVVDVSPSNDWTEVRVQFGEGGPLGSVYPVNGFIYGWSETGARIAQPRFSLDYALWSPRVPSVRMFNAISYVWALPAAERKHALAAAGVAPNPGAGVASRGRPVLVLGPVGAPLNAGALGRTLGVNRLDIGAGSRVSVFGPGRYVIQ